MNVLRRALRVSGTVSARVVLEAVSSLLQRALTWILQSLTFEWLP